MKRSIVWVVLVAGGMVSAMSAAWASTPACEELPALLREMMTNTNLRIKALKKEYAGLRYASERDRKAGKAFADELVDQFDNGVISALGKVETVNEGMYEGETPELARVSSMIAKENTAFWVSYKAAKARSNVQKKAMAEGVLALFEARKRGLLQREKELNKLCPSQSPDRTSPKVNLSPQSKRILEEDVIFGGGDENASGGKKPAESSQPSKPAEPSKPAAEPAEPAKPAAEPAAEPASEPNPK